MTSGKILRLLLMAALTPPLLYHVRNLAFGWGMWPVWHWMLTAAAILAAGLAGAAAFWWPAQRVNKLLQGLEVLARYCVAFLLIFFAINKVIPGQFLLYNRDFDLPLRDLPPRRLAWHFLGHSPLYYGFIAASEFIAGVLLCWSRTALGGLLLAAGVMLNVVAVDVAFGIRALPIAATMALAALVMLAGQLHMLRPLVWRARSDTKEASWLTRNDLLSLGVLVVILGFSLNEGVRTRRGLMRQLPPAGRWEVVECSPNPGLALCQPRKDGTRSVLYLEVGLWGQLVTDSERRGLAFTYDHASKNLEITVQPRDSTAEPNLILRGTVAATDTTVVLQASSQGMAPFDVRLRRTHHAPW
ncbi:MAG: hypothetical protein ACR2L2_19540 [Acidobacteriota bacterium]